MTPFPFGASSEGGPTPVHYEPPKDGGGKSPERMEEPSTELAQRTAVEVRQLLHSDLRLERYNRKAYPEADRTFAAEYDTDLAADGNEQVRLTVGPMGGIAAQARFDFTHRILDPKTQQFAETRFHVEPNRPITVAEAGEESSAEANKFDQRLLIDKLSALKRLTEQRLAQLTQTGEGR